MTGKRRAAGRGDGNVKSPDRTNTAGGWLAAIVALGALAVGYDQGAMSGALLFLKHVYRLTVFEREAMVSIVIVGSFVGAIFSGRWCDAAGRRTVLLLASALSGIFAVATGLAPTYATFMASRFLIGVTIGMIVVAAPMYISEFSRTAMRGRTSATFQLAFAIGLAGSYWVDFLFSKSGNWRAMFMVGAVPSLILLISLLLVPDSPRWYFMKGRAAEGEAALRRVIPEDGPRRAEVERISGELQRTRDLRRASLADLLRPAVRMALLFAVGLSFFGQFTGINTVTYYSPTVFRYAGFARSDAIFITAAIGIITVLATVAGIWLVDRWGRRPLMLTSQITIVTAMTLLGLSFYLGPRLPGMAVLTVGSVVLFHIAFSMGMGLMGWVYVPEVFPNRVRAQGQSIARLVTYLSTFTITLTFLSMLTALGAAGTFWIFAAVTLLGAIFVSWIAPETKNRPLETVEAYWSNNRQWPAPDPGADDPARG